jgi:hypothetical protein
MLFVLSAFCFVLQLTWWQATHVVAGEDLEAAVRRALFAVAVSSCRIVACLNHVSLKYISSTEKVYSSLYFVFIDADVSSVVNESVAPQTHANEHAPTPIDDVLMDPIPSVRLHDTTQSLAKFSPRSCRPLDQPRCRRASRVHYVKGIEPANRTRVRPQPANRTPSQSKPVKKTPSSSIPSPLFCAASERWR